MYIVIEGPDLKEVNFNQVLDTFKDQNHRAYKRIATTIIIIVTISGGGGGGGGESRGTPTPV